MVYRLTSNNKFHDTPLFESQAEAKKYQMFASRKYEAKQARIPWTINIWDVDYVTHCPLLGMENADT